MVITNARKFGTQRSALTLQTRHLRQTTCPAHLLLRQHVHHSNNIDVAPDIIFDAQNTRMLSSSKLPKFDTQSRTTTPVATPLSRTVTYDPSILRRGVAIYGKTMKLSLAAFVTILPVSMYLLDGGPALTCRIAGITLLPLWFVASTIARYLRGVFYCGTSGSFMN